MLFRSTGIAGPCPTETGNWTWFWLSLGVAMAGAIIRIITSGFAALGTSGNTKKGAVASELNTTGPYSLVRNPLYVGRILNFTGLAMLTGSWVYGAIIFLASIIVYERISVYEEEFLRKEFGEAHAKWAAEVPALLPRLHGWVKPKYPFWWRRMIWRENKKLFWLATAILLYHLARLGFDGQAISDDFHGTGHVYYVIYGAILVIELVIRALRHFTKTFSGLS